MKLVTLYIVHMGLKVLFLIYFVYKSLSVFAGFFIYRKGEFFFFYRFLFMGSNLKTIIKKLI